MTKQGKYLQSGCMSAYQTIEFWLEYQKCHVILCERWNLPQYLCQTYLCSLLCSLHLSFFGLSYIINSGVLGERQYINVKHYYSLGLCVPHVLVLFKPA